MEKRELIIDVALFKKYGIESQEVIEYLEKKQAVTLKPIHVNAYQYLKNQTVVSS